jgi:hypothetical protein
MRVALDAGKPWHETLAIGFEARVAVDRRRLRPQWRGVVVLEKLRRWLYPKTIPENGREA